MSELTPVEPSQLDDIIKNTKLLRDAARQHKQHLLAEKIQKIVAAAEKAIETLLKPAATDNARTITETSATINGKDNNNNNNTNNITKQMGQSEKVLRP